MAAGQQQGARSQGSWSASAVPHVDLWQVTFYLCLSFLTCKMQELDYIGLSGDELGECP